MSDPSIQNYIVFKGSHDPLGAEFTQGNYIKEMSNVKNAEQRGNHTKASHGKINYYEHQSTAQRSF